MFAFTILTFTSFPAATHEMNIAEQLEIYDVSFKCNDRLELVFINAPRIFTFFEEKKVSVSICRWFDFNNVKSLILECC